MTSFEKWLKINKNALKYLFIELVNISNNYGIFLTHNKFIFNNFILMMYSNSNKEIINKELYPEFFYKKINSFGYQNYQILN
jgi:hypothetical protein